MSTTVCRVEYRYSPMVAYIQQRRTSALGAALDVVQDLAFVCVRAPHRSWWDRSISQGMAANTVSLLAVGISCDVFNIWVNTPARDTP